MTGCDKILVFVDRIPVMNYSALQFICDRNPVNYEEIKGI